jgi:hypothetical protein
VTPREAGASHDSYIRPSLPVVRAGTKRLWSVAAVEAWLEQHGSAPLDELGSAA